MAIGLGNFAETCYPALAKAIPELFEERKEVPIARLGANAPVGVSPDSLALTLPDHGLREGDHLAMSSIRRNNLVVGKTYDAINRVITFEMGIPHDRDIYQDYLGNVVFPTFEKFTITGVGEFEQGQGEQPGVYLKTRLQQEDENLPEPPNDPAYLEETIYLGQTEFEVVSVIDDDTIAINFPEAVAWLDSDTILISADVILYGNINIVVDDDQIQMDIDKLNYQDGLYVWLAGGDLTNSLEEGEALISSVQVNQTFDIVLGQVHSNPAEANLFGYKATGEYLEQIIRYMHGNSGYRFLDAGFLKSNRSRTLFGLKFTRNLQIDLSTDLDRQDSRKITIIGTEIDNNE